MIYKITFDDDKERLGDTMYLLEKNIISVDKTPLGTHHQVAWSDLDGDKFKLYHVVKIEQVSQAIEPEIQFRPEKF